MVLLIKMEEALIENVRKHNCIYNVTSAAYRDQNMRQRAWEEIGYALNIAASEAKDRYEKLRRCFCNARNRRRDDIRSGMPHKRKSLWKYESQMDFLTPFMETRKTQIHLNNSPSEIEDIKEDVSAIRTMDEEHPPVFVDVQSNTEASNHQSIQDNTTNKKAKRYEFLRTVQAKKRQKLIDKPLISESQILDIPKENAEHRIKTFEENTKPSIQNNAEPMDEMDMFFLSMSRMTKQLPKVKQAEIKLAVSNAVLLAEINNEENKLY